MKKRLGNIGHTAHFGGAIGGYVMSLLFKPDLFFYRNINGNSTRYSNNNTLCFGKIGEDLNQKTLFIFTSCRKKHPNFY